MGILNNLNPIVRWSADTGWATHVTFLKWAESIYEISDNLCYWVIPSAHNEHKEKSVSRNKDWLSDRNATLVLTDELVLTSAAYV